MSRAESSKVGGGSSPLPLSWRAGNQAVRSHAIALAERLLANDPQIDVLMDKPGRRRIAKGGSPEMGPCLMKHYLAPDKPSLWVRTQRTLGFSTAAREFANLHRARTSGVAVPEALAHITAPDGEEIVVLRFLEGQSLAEALATTSDRRALLHAVGRLVAQYHESGSTHRDLHRGNVWVTREGPVLLDLQEALPFTGRALLWRDRGELDASLAPLLSMTEQLTLRMAMLGVSRPLSETDKTSLRRLALAGAVRRRAHVVSRTMRSLRPGRLYARFEAGSCTGMRWRESDETQVRRCLSDPTSEADFEVRSYQPESRGEAARWYRDGSPARHAWVASHGLRARNISAPAAIAYVEKHDRRQVTEAWLVLRRSPELQQTAATLRQTVGLLLHARREGILHTALQEEKLPGLGESRALQQLESIRFAPRRGGASDAHFDAYLENCFSRAEPTRPEEVEIARWRYRTGKAFQVLP